MQLRANINFSVQLYLGKRVPRVSLIHRMEDLTFLVQIRPAVCALAPLVFLVVRACSVFFNAGPSSEKCFQRVLTVLDSILLL